MGKHDIFIIKMAGVFLMLKKIQHKELFFYQCNNSGPYEQKFWQFIPVFFIGIKKNPSLNK